MKNLYAIRNKETGGIYRHTFVPIYTTREGAEFYIREKLNSEKYEPVTLRIEPTEPCEFCRDFVIFLAPKRQDVPVVEEGEPAKLCPWCGRRLNHD